MAEHLAVDQVEQIPKTPSDNIHFSYGGESITASCMYVKQLQTVREVETKADYDQACDELVKLKRRSRERGGTDLADLVQLKWRKAKSDWSRRFSDIKERNKQKELWQTTKSDYHSEMTMYFIKILTGVKWVFENNIAHSKLKLDNIIMERNVQGSFEPKVIAFNYESNTKQMPLDLQAPAFASPERVFFNKRRMTYVNYNVQKDDVWQLGCILYMMLAHQAPYKAISSSDYSFRCITNGTFASESPSESAGEQQSKTLKQYLKDQQVLFMFNPQALDLLQRIFVPEADRILLEDIFLHPWLTKELESMMKNGDFEDDMRQMINGIFERSKAMEKSMKMASEEQ